jgi:cysteinyl-tRNA synthetase
VLRLYDTRSRAVVDIVPAHPGALTLYCCGPTVYRDAHVGNLRTFLLGDLVRRVAELDGLQVRMVQNITDVGHMADDDDLDAAGSDKMLTGAAAEGRDPMDVARHYEATFHADLALLGVRPAHAYPRASESIGLMLDLVGRLVEQGHAYVGTDGSVFYDAAGFPSYGALSGNRLDALRPGHRSEGAVDEAKRFHADWALWKRAGDRRQLVWDSPWGPGFPGWHIECSAMSMHFLGDVIDVHTGGIDLRFPHHEDERAQSDASAGHEVVQHWVHGEHLLFEGRKMAKSTGNVVLLRDVVTRGLDPLALRLAFLGTRYRTQVDLSWDALAAADRQLTRWRDRVAEWAEAPSRPVPAEVAELLVAVLLDDLDTPRALQVLRRLARDDTVPAGAKFETFAYADRVLGLDLVRAVGRPRDLLPPKPGELPPGAADLLAARAAARAAKDWTESDRLREALAALDVHVTDTPAGQTWTRSHP